MNEILEEAKDLKKSYITVKNMESMWSMKEEAFWRDKYYNFLKNNSITDKDVLAYMYPSRV